MTWFLEYVFSRDFHVCLITCVHRCLDKQLSNIVIIYFIHSATLHLQLKTEHKLSTVIAVCLRNVATPTPSQFALRRLDRRSHTCVPQRTINKLQPSYAHKVSHTSGVVRGGVVRFRVEVVVVRGTYAKCGGVCVYKILELLSCCTAPKHCAAAASRRKICIYTWASFVLTVSVLCETLPSTHIVLFD